MTTIYDFSARTIEGDERSFEDYRGRVLLVVNVASKCGFTPQYAGLEALYRKHADAGLTVLGFPCDQFGNQEPGDEAEIASFCSTTYDVSFPMFAKVEVNGADVHPLYEWLKEERGGLLGGRVKWNFTKFLVGGDGEVVGRHGPRTTPDDIENDVVKALAATRD